MTNSDKGQLGPRNKYAWRSDLAARLMLLLTLVPACFGGGGSEGSADLDVEMPEASKGEPSDDGLTYAGAVPVKGISPGAKLSSTAVIDWQAFFKPPPGKDQRGILEKKLESWQEDGDADKLLEKARVEIALGRVAAAEASLLRALRLKDEHPEAMIELVILNLKKRQLDNAFELLGRIRDRILQSDDVSQSYVFRYRYSLAMAHLARGERDKGHKVLSDLLGVDAGFAPAYVALATSYLGEGKESVAEFVARRGLDRVKDQAPLHNILGAIAFRTRQWEKARQWFDQALEKSPHYVPALVNRAALSVANLELQAAEQDLLVALERDPTNIDALVGLGVVQKRQGNYSAAKATFSKALDLSPEDARTRFNLAVLYADNLKKPNEAMRLFSEVLAIPQATHELKVLARGYLDGLRPSGEG